MEIKSVTKSLARFTRPLRRLFDRKQLARLTRVPRTLLTKGGVGERLVELENRFERLQLGWNQHIPSLLERMSDALDAAHHAEDGHRRLDTIREDLDRLSSRLELHLMDRKSRPQAPYGDNRHFAGVTFAIADDRGFVISRGARDLPIAPRSIHVISVSACFEIGREGEALDEMLAEWFALLVPGGRLEIDRFGLVDSPDSSRAADIDVAAWARASPSNGVICLPEMPTDAQIIQALERHGFMIEEVERSSRGFRRTLVGLRPARFGA